MCLIGLKEIRKNSFNINHIMVKIYQKQAVMAFVAIKYMVESFLQLKVRFSYSLLPLTAERNYVNRCSLRKERLKKLSDTKFCWYFLSPQRCAHAVFKSYMNSNISIKSCRYFIKVKIALLLRLKTIITCVCMN